MRVTINGAVQDIETGATVADIVRIRGVDSGPVAVAVNAEVVPRGSWADKPLREGDRIEVLTAVPGG